MYLSVQKCKFLLDENVRKELFDFLKKSSFDVVQIRGLKNGKVAELSIKEKRVLVTNDSDFTNIEMYPKNKVFSVVLLRVAQSRPDLLLKSFSTVSNKETEYFEGNIFELTEEGLKALHDKIH